MPGGAGKTGASLKRHLLEEPWRCGFFQLVHLLETWQDRPVEIGARGPYQEETLRFVPEPSMVFPASDVRRLEEWVEGMPGGRGSLRMTVTFMGLYGSAAPTPTYFTELIGFTDVDAEPLTDFLDIFNHRLVSLYYRAWQKYRFPYRYLAGGLDRGGRDLLSFAALSFCGLGEDGVRRQARLPVARLTGYLGLLGPHSRPPVNLELLLADFFGGLPVAIKPWVLRWVAVPEGARCRLGEANSSLGRDLTIGEQVPDRGGKFRVSVGPLGYDEFRELLPESENFRQLCGLVRLWVGGRYEYDVELIVRRDEVPGLSLEDEGGARLGWTSWVNSTGGLDEDPAVVFAGSEAPVEPAPAQEEAA